MAEDAFVTDFEHIMADDITDDVRFIMYDSASGKTASAGEVSKYMMKNVHVDTTLTEEGSAADAKAVGDALATKADTKGRYEDIVAGGAEQLMADGHETDTDPYQYRPTGGSADVGNREYLDKIVGGTVAWNQQAPNTELTGAGSRPSVLGARIVKGHKYLFGAYLDVDEQLSTNAYISPYGFDDEGNVNTFCVLNGQSKGDIYKIGECTVRGVSDGTGSNVDGNFWFYMNAQTGSFKNLKLFDLTQMFGSTIADYIYSLETATAGAGVAWFRNYFPDAYYPYDKGTLRSVEGVSAHETVGFNAWDEEWELGAINSDTGMPSTSTTIIRAKKYIPILPNTGYYFNVSNIFRVFWYDSNKNYIGYVGNYNSPIVLTPPTNARYMKFHSVSTIYHHDICINLSDPTRNGEYEPYQKHTYPLDSSLTLRGVPKLADGKLAFDGDVYTPSGEVQRRYGLRAYQSGDESLADAITDGANTVYKLATPTTETAEGYEHYQTCDPSGTEEFVTTGIVPIGHETRYPHDLKKKIETAPDSPSADGTYLMKRSGGKNAYMALPSTPSANGAYVLTVTVSGGTASYSWTAKE